MELLYHPAIAAIAIAVAVNIHGNRGLFHDVKDLGAKDLDYLLKNTRFEEDEIKEWYRSV